MCVCNFVLIFLFNRHVGPYGDWNRPRYLREILLVGKFASSARSPMSAMSTPTNQQPKDVTTLNMLQDFIVNAYRPGDIVLVGMGQLTSICIGH